MKKLIENKNQMILTCYREQLRDENNKRIWADESGSIGKVTNKVYALEIMIPIDDPNSPDCKYILFQMNQYEIKKLIKAVAEIEDGKEFEEFVDP